MHNNNTTRYEPDHINLLMFNRTKNGVEVSKIKELEGHVQILDKENKLIISKPTVKDAGNYTCSIPELKLTAEIRAIGEYTFQSICVINVLFTRTTLNKTMQLFFS